MSLKKGETNIRREKAVIAAYILQGLRRQSEVRTEGEATASMRLYRIPRERKRRRERGGEEKGVESGRESRGGRKRGRKEREERDIHMPSFFAAFIASMYYAYSLVA